MKSKKQVLGVGIDDLPLEAAILKLESLSCGKHHYFVTPNPEFLVESSRSALFKKVLNHADLSLPDGVGLKIFSKVDHRVAGVDVFQKICALSEEKGYSIFLLGGFGNVSDRLRSALQKDFPRIRILGNLEGSPEASDDERVVSKIKEITNGEKIDFLFVAYGHPKQELWIARNVKKLNIGVAGGIGGTFDFYLGVQKRAPYWLRKIGFEWLWRLWRDPKKRFRRICNAVVVFPLLVLADLIGISSHS